VVSCLAGRPTPGAQFGWRPARGGAQAVCQVVRAGETGAVRHLGHTEARLREQAHYNDSCENGPCGLLPAQLSYRLGF